MESHVFSSVPGFKSGEVIYAEPYHLSLYYFDLSYGGLYFRSVRHPFLELTKIFQNIKMES